LWIVDVSSGEQRRLLGARDGDQPAWSPDGRRIAFWGLRPGTVQRDIYTMPASGGEPVAVTDDPAVDWSPLWSADGRFLYFATNRSGAMSIWRIPIDAASGRPAGDAVPISASGSNLGQLSRSADGRRLAYTSFTPDANVNRVRFDPERGAIDGDLSPVTRGSVNWYNLDVSPDNTMMALSPIIRQEDLYVGSADGTGSLRQLTNDPAMDRRPRWSPDGSQLAFYSTRTTATNVWLIRPDGSGAHALTESATHILYPTWSPDGRRLAYVDQPTGKIQIIDPAKPPNANQIETLPAFENGRGVALWHWSPDGQKLILSKGGLVVFDFSRRTYERLLPIGGSGRWLGDSRRFLFSETSQIRLFDMTTRHETTLLTLKGQSITQLALPADNRMLYFLSNAVEGDIYMIEFPAAGAR
jgi:Tol biopolymer transport system component